MHSHIWLCELRPSLFKGINMNAQLNQVFMVMQEAGHTDILKWLEHEGKTRLLNKTAGDFFSCFTAITIQFFHESY